MKKSQLALSLAVGVALVGAVATQTQAFDSVSGMFQVDEVSAPMQVAEGGEHKCGEGACGGKEDGEHKCGSGACGSKDGEHKCGEGQCGSHDEGEKGGEHKCGEGACG